MLNGYLYNVNELAYNFLYERYRLKKCFTVDEAISKTKLSKEEINELYNKYFILPENIKEKELAKFNFDIFRTNSVSISYTICPTLKCNLGCIYCFEKERELLSMNEAIARDVANFIFTQTERKEINEIRLIWYGGEPLLNFEIIKYIINLLKEKIQNKRINSALVTNGTLLTPEILQELERLSIYRIQVCLDGDEESHNKCRPFKNGSGS